MADAPKKPTDASAEPKPATPQEAEAQGAQAKLEADSKPDAAKTNTSSTNDSTATASSNSDNSGGTPAGAKNAATGADATPEKKERQAEGEDGHEQETEPSLYERTLGKFDSIDEIKKLFSRGAKPTSGDLAKLPTVQVEGADTQQARLEAAAAAPEAEAKPDATKEAGGKTLTLTEQLTNALGTAGDAAMWAVKAITPDPIERLASDLGSSIAEGYDWLTDWYSSNDSVLKNEQSAGSASNDFAKLVEGTVLSKGETAEKTTAEQSISSRLPAGTSLADVDRMLKYGLGEGASFDYNYETGTYTEKVCNKDLRYVENEDGSKVLILSNGTRVSQDKDGNRTYLFGDGAVEAKADGTYKQSFGDWQRKQIEASEPLRNEIQQVVRNFERDDAKSRGRNVSESQAEKYKNDALEGKTFNGQALTPEQIDSMLKNGIPDAKTETLNSDGPEKGSKVQDLGGVKRIESADGKTVTLQFPDGTKVVQNDKGTSYVTQRPDGKFATLTIPPEGGRFQLSYGDVTVQGLDQIAQRVDNSRNKRVGEIVSDTYAELRAKGKSHDEALAEIAKEQMIGGPRDDGEGNRHGGFLQQIDGKWYQVSSNGRDFYLREINEGQGGRLDVGRGYKFDPASGKLIDGRTGDAWDAGPRVQVGPDGKVTVGGEGGLSFVRDGKHLTVSGAVHSLTLDGAGNISFNSRDGKTTDEIRSAVATDVVTDLRRDDKVLGGGTIRADGTFDTDLQHKGPDGVVKSDQVEVRPNGDVVVPGQGGLTFKANGDIVSSNGEKLFDAASGSWSEKSGITGGSSRSAELQARENNAKAQAEGSKAASLGAMVLSLRFAGPSAANMMRSLALFADSTLKGAESMASSSMDLGALGTSISLSSYRGAVNDALVASNRSQQAVNLLGPDLSAYQLGTAIAEITGSIGKTPSVMVNLGGQSKAA